MLLCKKISLYIKCSKSSCSEHQGKTNKYLGKKLVATNKMLYVFIGSKGITSQLYLVRLQWECGICALKQPTYDQIGL